MHGPYRLYVMDAHCCIVNESVEYTIEVARELESLAMLAVRKYHSW